METQPLPTTTSSEPQVSQTKVFAIILGGILILCFFLPAFKILGVAVSPFALSKEATQWKFLWAVPLLGLGIILSEARSKSSAVFCVMAGITPLAIVGYYAVKYGTELFQILSIGAWLAVISGFLLCSIASRRK